MNPSLPGRTAIRADGGGEIGLGHVMRCSALAGAFNALGQRPLFITATPEYLPAGLDAVADIRCLDGDETGAGLTGYLASAGTALLVGDWQQVDAALVAAVRASGILTVLVGGRTDGATPDLLIRQTLVASASGPAIPVLDGPEVLLLHPDYAGLPPREIAPQARRVLVSLGGTDTPLLGTIEHVLDRLSIAHGLQVEIRRPAARPGMPPRLRPALEKADIGILAGGTTLHEAAATGLPVICVPIAGNQAERAGQVEPLGLGLTIPPGEAFDERLSAALEALIPDAERRGAMARAGQALVDGRGAERVARQLIERVLPAGAAMQ